MVCTPPSHVPDKEAAGREVSSHRVRNFFLENRTRLMSSNRASSLIFSLLTFVSSDMQSSNPPDSRRYWKCNMSPENSDEGGNMSCSEKGTSMDPQTPTTVLSSPRPARQISQMPSSTNRSQIRHTISRGRDRAKHVRYLCHIFSTYTYVNTYSYMNKFVHSYLCIFTYFRHYKHHNIHLHTYHYNMSSQHTSQHTYSHTKTRAHKRAHT